MGSATGHYTRWCPLCWYDTPLALWRRDNRCTGGYAHACQPCALGLRRARRRAILQVWKEDALARAVRGDRGAAAQARWLWTGAP